MNYGKKPIIVLHVLPGFHGGISSYVKNLIKGSYSLGVKHYVVGYGRCPDEYVNTLKQYGVSVRSLPGWRQGLKRHFIEIMKSFQGCSFDVFHCHFSGVRSLVFKFLARRAGIPVVFTHAHRSDDEKKLGIVARSIERICSRSFSDRFLACSDVAGEYIFGRSVLSDSRYAFLPNGIDFKEYSQVLRSSAEDLTITKRRILHVGRFAPQKNQSFCIQIARAIKDRGLCSFSIVFVGDGSQREIVESYAHSLQVADVVSFLGRRDDIPQIMSNSDVLILPSLFEGLPTVVIEAQAAGLRCLVSNAVTRQCDLGLGLVTFLDINSPDLWVDACLNPPVSVDINERYKAFSDLGFTCDAMGSRYCDILEGCLR